LCEILVDSLLELHPRDKHCRIFAGMMWAGYDELKAIDYYKKAIKLDKYYAAPHLRSAVLMKRLNMYEEAHKSYMKYFDYGAESEFSQIVWGNYRLELGEDQEALNHYKIALDYNPGYSFAYWYIIWTYVRLGQFDNAMKYCEQLSNSGIPSNNNIEHFRFNIRRMSISWMATVQFVQYNFNSTMMFIDSLIQTDRIENDINGMLWELQLKSWYQMEADQPDSALNTLSGALKLTEEADIDLKTRETGYLWTYGTMSVLYGRMGKLKQAEDYLDKARTIYKSKYNNAREKEL